jgi:rhodanese-related sulfurtransferase
MEMTVPYAGDLDPAESYRLLSDDPAAVLVDVRTRAEWSYVGGPDLAALGRPVVQVEWVSFPNGVRNESFLAELAAAGVPKQAPVLFLCRSGVRSVAAAEAATAAGYARAYNILQGFEGNPDGAGHRGTTSGWKVAGLPWLQP